MNSARIWRAVGAHNSAKQSVNLLGISSEYLRTCVSLSLSSNSS